MDLAFETAQLRSLCESQEEAEQTFGRFIAQALRTCLAEMEASASVEEFMLVRAASMSEDHIHVVLGEGHELVFRQSHLNSPAVDGLVDWSKVYRVRILNIGIADA